MSLEHFQILLEYLKTIEILLQGWVVFTINSSEFLELQLYLREVLSRIRLKIKALSQSRKS